MKKDPRVYLAHILECARKIARYTKGGEKKFLSDTMLQDAVIRNFEIIGEAAKRVPEPYRKTHSQIPWRLMAGFRDVLIHGYDSLAFFIRRQQQKKPQTGLPFAAFLR